MAFEFFGVGRIIFGRGKLTSAGELARPLGKKAIIVHNGKGADRLESLLSQSALSSISHRQQGEPAFTDVDTAAELARREKCDCVIGYGGGSAIDAAKAVAGLLTNGGSSLDYLEVVGKGQKITKRAAPWMAIPTTAGTGAEATRNAVIAVPKKKFKASMRSELLLPMITLIDSELGVGVPAHVTASSGMDALCQLIESYTSNNASPLTDALALQGIELAAKSLARAFHKPDDLDAREGMALAALFSGITLTNAGLGAVHGFAAPLGANFPAPHGAICAVLLPLVIETNIEALRKKNSPVLARYAQIGQLLPGSTEIDDIARCVKFTSDLAKELKIPRLGEFGLNTGHIAEMVSLAQKSSSMRYNPVVLTAEELSSILSRAI